MVLGLRLHGLGLFAAATCACGAPADLAGGAVAADGTGGDVAGKFEAGDAGDGAPGATDVAPTFDGAAAETVAADSLAATDDADAVAGDTARLPLADAEDAAALTDGDGAQAADVGDAAPAQDATLAGPQGVWDLAAVSNVAAAQCQFSNKHTVFQGLTALDAWNLSYISWEVVDGAPKPILIRGFAARPQGDKLLPGVVQAHGLGGMSKENDATSLAAKLGMFVIAYTGPGGGDKPENTSEGLGAGAQNGYHLFDTLKDVRGSWFWGHAMAAMRGVTCLTARPDVDASKLGVTGFSAGGVVSTLLAAHDPRIVAAVPLSGTLAWDVATQSPTAWQHELLMAAGLTVASAEWQKLIAELIAPAVAFSAASKAHLLAMDGTTDEFFPLSALSATFNTAPDPDKRMSLAANFDHGCYLLTALVEDKAKIEQRAKDHVDGGQLLWFHHWFGTDPTYKTLPEPPQVSVQGAGGATLIAAVVDTKATALTVEAVHAWVSTDDAYTFLDVQLEKGTGVWSKLIAGSQGPNTVYFVDVTYKTASLVPAHVSISSPPFLPAGHVPHIRKQADCL